MPNPAPGTAVYKYTGSGFTLSTFDEFDLIWTPNGNETIDLGGGVWVSSPTAQTITFVGEVPTGTLTTPTPNGFSIRSSQVPQQAPVSTLGLQPSAGTSLYRFANPGGFSLFTYDEFDLIWTPSEPVLNVGEAVWLNSAPGTPATLWQRTFTL
jgi:hypothetical protein